MNEIFDVAVVGYGPTGMVAASLLGQAGHRVLVCERWPALYGLPRLTHIDDETARAVQAAGNVDEALRDSSPTDYVWVNGRDEVLFRTSAVTDGPMGFPTHISMYQPDVEDSIDRRIRSLPDVEVRQGCQVVGLSQGHDAVELTLAPLADGPRVQVRARYVIAADGSRSTVRSLLGIERDDFGFDERMLNVDTEWLRPAPAEFRTTKQYCDPARGHMFMIIGQRRQRFEFGILPGESDGDFTTPEAAWRLLGDMHDLGPDDVRIIRQLVYRFEARVARRWRDGRVLLAGDAAHTMPPSLGQGACSGIRDASNLAWKLDLVLRGRADAALLDTYELERRPHATAVTHMSMGLGAIAAVHDPESAARRDAAFAAGEVPPPPAMPGVVDGVVHHRADGGVAPPDGGLVPQGRVTAGDRSGRFDDVVGRGFVLVTSVDLALPEDQRHVLDQLGCHVVRLGTDVIDDDGVHAAYLQELGAVAYLARPDFVLFGSAADSAGIATLVDELGTRLGFRAAVAS